MGRVGQFCWMKGKHHTIESRQKLSESHKGIFEGSKNPNWKGGKVKKICLNCGKEFEVKPYPKKAFELRKFCSCKCAYKYRKDKGLLKGKANPQWQGGISFGKYCPKFNNEFKERVRKFFNYTCQMCGHIWQYGERRLSVHHVNYDKTVCCSSVKPLFIPVCSGECHTKTNFNREYWEDIFTKKIMLEYDGECYFPKGCET